jgi:GGDEF domain-containing protein
MATTQVRVLLAMSSPLVRLRLRHVLLQDPTINLIGEANDGPQVAQVARDLGPQIILCDERILAEPSLEAFFTPRVGKVDCRVVVVAANVRTVPRQGRIPVVAVLPIDLPADDMGPELQQAVQIDLTEEKPAPTRVAGYEDRFVSADDFRQGADGRAGSGTEILRRVTPPVEQHLPMPGMTRAPGMGLPQPPTGGMILRTTRLGGVSRRREHPAQDRLASLLKNIQGEQAQQRDSVTGLANTKALGNALRILPTIGHPAAVVLVDLWYAPHTPVPSDPQAQAGILRAAGAALRAHTRSEDLICRLDGMTFAIVMPGLDATTAPTPMRRLRNSMEFLRQPTDERPYALAVAMGVGFWEHGIPPAQPLERGWRAMVAEREAMQS